MTACLECRSVIIAPCSSSPRARRFEVLGAATFAVEAGYVVGHEERSMHPSLQGFDSGVGWCNMCYVMTAPPAPRMSLGAS